MSFSSRLAKHLLRVYGHLDRFDVDLLDETSSSSLAQALEEEGCEVCRSPYHTKLHVKPPHKPPAQTSV